MTPGVVARTAAAAIVLVSALALAADDPRERLWQAAKDGDVAAVAALLDSGIDPDAEFRQGGTALLFAAQRGRAEVVRLLLVRGADVGAVETLNGTTALHFGISYPEVVRLLVEHGADVNARDLQAGQAPLWWAVTKRQPESARALLGSGRIEARALREGLAAAESLKLSDLAAEVRAALGASAAVPSWPQFRGRNAAGVADGERPPTQWSVESGLNVSWRTPIPGLGHASPVVWGDRLFVATAVGSQPTTDLRKASPMDSAADMSPHAFKVYALDRRSGEVLWERTAASGVPKTKRHPKNSFASPTPATDGRRLVVMFGSHGLYCYDLDGNLLWKRDLGTLDTGFFYDPDYQWGDASSPVLYRDTVIVQSDLQRNSVLAAFSLADGRPVWRTPRDELPSWGTPTLYEGPGGGELATNGIRRIRGYDPATGKELWHLDTGNSMIAASTPVLALGELWIVGNGYRPLKPIYAIRRGSRGDLSLGDAAANAGVAWSKKAGGPYYTTPLVYGEHLYVLADNGVLTVYYARTGEEIYRQRIGETGATFSASPVAADSHVYLASEDGKVYVVRAGIEYQLVAANPVGELTMATPAIADGMIYVRTRHHVLGIAAAPAASPSG